MGAKARAEMATPGGAHPTIAAAVAAGGPDEAVGWRVYDAVVAKWPGTDGGVSKAVVAAVDLALPIFAR